MSHILIVEDDYDLANITQINLTHAGYTSDIAYDAASAEKLLKQNEYDLILMDMMLPDNTGDKLCRLVREVCSYPVIFISCLDDSNNIINALNCGGDDYVTKPVNFDVLLARIDANIRRFKAQPVEDKKQTGPLREFRRFTIDTLRRRVIQDGKEVNLSSIEYSLLLYMSENPETLLLYNDLYNYVWESESHGDVRTVMVHISNLRKKIDSAHTGIIETVRGAGYIFCDI
ncbi:MAG: response regulator transcription factor [Oscillospiraceae bacterium]|nr:response regulator transcription factor [Oscillospiraceae bacterium]